LESPLGIELKLPAKIIMRVIVVKCDKVKKHLSKKVSGGVFCTQLCIALNEQREEFVLNVSGWLSADRGTFEKFEAAKCGEILHAKEGVYDGKKTLSYTYDSSFGKEWEETMSTFQAFATLMGSAPRESAKLVDQIDAADKVATTTSRSRK
jgi:hypothetical protein